MEKEKIKLSSDRFKGILIGVLIILLSVIGLATSSNYLGYYISYGLSYAFGELYLPSILLLITIGIYLILDLFKNRQARVCLTALILIFISGLIFMWFFVEAEGDKYFKLIGEIYSDRFKRSLEYNFIEIIGQDGLNQGGIVGLSIYCFLAQLTTRIGALIITGCLDLIAVIMVVIVFVQKKTLMGHINKTFETLSEPNNEINYVKPRESLFEMELEKPLNNNDIVFGTSIEEIEEKEQSEVISERSDEKPKATLDKEKLKSNYKKFNVFEDTVYSSEDRILDVIGKQKTDSNTKFDVFEDSIDDEEPVRIVNDVNCDEEVVDMNDSPFMVKHSSIEEIEIKKEPSFDDNSPYIKDNPIHNKQEVHYEQTSFYEDSDLSGDEFYDDSIFTHPYEEPAPKPEPKPIVEEFEKPRTVLEDRQIDGNVDDIFVNKQKKYKLPSASLLNDPKLFDSSQNETNAKLKEVLIDAKLKSLGIQGHVVDHIVAPAFTRFEIEVADNVKINTIPSISKDLMMALAASKINVLAPIPGTKYIGVEIPNEKRSTVTFKECFTDIPFDQQENKLLINVGKDINNKSVNVKIDACPHLLVAGTTGSGKSVCLNSIIMSIIMRAHPDEVNLILIDPKMVEFIPYQNVPHLLCPIISDVKKVGKALEKLCEEMERRYKFLAKFGKRDIKSYNKYMESIGKEKIPYIVCIIDEVADIMLQARNEVESNIARLAGKARSAGIHLIVATQRPTVDIITGIIKSNIQSRIAFSVSSGQDSRVILDEQGAEELLGQGDMILKVGGQVNQRVQGCYVADEEIDRVTEYLAAHNECYYNPQFLNLDPPQPEQIKFDDIVSNDDEPRDDVLYDKILNWLVDRDNVSNTMLKRIFSIGYSTAARMLDRLEADGIIGPVVGNNPRTVDHSKLAEFMQ